MTFAPHSLRATFERMQGRVSLDSKAVQNLELVPQYSGGAAASGEDIQRQLNFLYATPTDLQRGQGGQLAKRGTRRRKAASSLFDIFPCKTPGGARLLRNSLMQPISDRDTLQARLDLVELLLADEDSYFALLDLLPHLSSLDHMTAGLVQVPREISPRTTAIQINLVLTLGATLQQLPKLHQIVQAMLTNNDVVQHQNKRRRTNANNGGPAASAGGGGASGSSGSESSGRAARRGSRGVLEALERNLRHEHYKDLQERLESVCDTRHAAVMPKAQPQLFQRFKILFAIKNGLDGLLDVSRRTFLEIIDGQQLMEQSQTVRGCQRSSANGLVLRIVLLLL
jgi:hypothetical protein